MSKLAFLVVILFLSSSVVSNAGDVILTCNGVRNIKQYDEKHEISFLAEVDVAKKTILLKEPTTVIHLDMTKNRPSTEKPEIKITKLKIYDEKEGILFVEKEGKVDDSYIIMGKSSGFFSGLPIIGRLFGSSYRTIEVREDDDARGVLNPYSGRLTVETRYYKTEGSQYEYGWSLSADCKNSQKLF
jgi:hypothetical protein